MEMQLPECNTNELSHKLQEQGFLVLEKVVPDSVLQQLKDQAAHLMSDFDPASHRSIFTTKDQADNSNDYFLDSASKISFFFEADAWDEEGNLRQAKELSINKIGHALHDLDPVFSDFCRSDLLKSVIQQIIGIEAPHLVQSMYIFKQPRIGGEVGVHQDNWFLLSNPLSCYGLWFALEDSTLENGCLWAVPGSHKEHPCQKHFERKGKEVSFDRQQMEHPAPDEAYVSVPVPKGSLIVLHGGLLHKSYANLSGESRQAFTFHIVDSASEWASSNWLQRPDMPFCGFDNPYLTR